MIKPDSGRLTLAAPAAVLLLLASSAAARLESSAAFRANTPSDERIRPTSTPDLDSDLPSAHLNWARMPSPLPLFAVAAEEESGIGLLATPHLSIDLPAERIEVEVGSFSGERPEAIAWTGKPAGDPLGEVVLVERDGSVLGTVRFEGHLYLITGNRADSEFHIAAVTAPTGLQCGTSDLAEVTDSEAVRKLQEAPPIRRVYQGAEPAAPLSSDSPDRIDILLVYTEAVRDALLNLPDLTTIRLFSDFLETQSNVSFSNNGIDLSFSIVDTLQVTYTETGDILTELDHIWNPNDGVIDNVHTAREAARADVVVFLVHDTYSVPGGEIAGVAKDILGRSEGRFSLEFESSAFAVATVWYSFIEQTFAHEVGHLLGAQHNWEETNEVLVHDYSHGYRDDVNEVRTIMAYDCPGLPLCQPLNYWSDPDAQPDGYPLGVAGGPTPSDNARLLQETRLFGANYRTSSGDRWGIAPISANLTLGSWGTVSISVLAPTEDQYYVGVWGPPSAIGLPLPPAWTWTDWSTPHQYLGAAGTTTFSFSVLPDTPQEEFQFWLYRRVGPSLYWPIHKVSVTLSAQGVDTVPPRVTSTSPEAGALVSPNAIFEITFSEAIAPGSITASTTYLAGSVSGSHSLLLNLSADGSTLAAAPTTPLTAGESATLTLTSGVTDLTGNGLDGDGNGTPGPSFTLNITAASAGTPNAPQNLSAQATSAEQVNLSWTDASTNEVGFRIERRIGASGTWQLRHSVGANVTSYDDVGVSEGITYFYRIRSYNASGDSGPSNVASATPTSGGGQVPGAPNGLQATTISSSAIRLAWSDNSSNESGFRIQRKDPGGNWFQIASVAANTVSYTNSSLAGATTYQYRIYSYNSSGSSGYSNIASATTESNAPAAPTNLVAWPSSATSVNLSWSDRSATEDGFEVERRTGPSGSWAVTGYTGRNDSDWTDNQVAPQTEYHYRVRAHNAEGYSGYSNTAQVTTCVPPDTPHLADPYDGEDNLPPTVELTWWSDADVSSYDLYFGESTPPPFLASVPPAPNPGDDTAYTASGLSTGHTYYWKVVAHASCNPSLVSTSMTRSFSIMGPPSAPQLLTPSNGATGVPTGVVIDWANVTSPGPTIYDLYFGTDSNPPFFEAMGTVTERLMTGLAPMTTYYWWVRAKNGDNPDLYSDSAVWSFTTGTASSTTVNLDVVKDAGLRGGSFGNTNYGGQVGGPPEQRAFGTGNDDNYYQTPGAAPLRGALQFDLTSIPAGSTIGNATLTLNFQQGVGAQPAPLTMNFDPYNASWVEVGGGSITWNNRPAVNTSHRVVGSFPLSGFNPLRINLTPLVQKWVNATIPNHGFEVSIPEWEGLTNRAKYFGQRENGAIFGGATLEVTYGTPCAAPAAPSAPVPADGSTGHPQSLTLDWSDAAGANSYKVYFGTSSPPTLLGVAPNSSYQVSGLSAGATYYWRVEALASCDPSIVTSSPTWTFGTTSCVAPSTPNLLAPTPSATGLPRQTNLAWSSVPGAGSYEVFLDQSNPPVLSAGTTASTTLEVALAPATTYYWKVRANAACDPLLTSESVVSPFTTAPRPQGEAGANRTVAVGEPTVLGGTPAASGGTPPYSYSWSVTPAGGSLSSSTAANPEFASPTPGNFICTLIVTDAKGFSSIPDQVVVTIPEAPAITVTPGSLDFGDVEISTHGELIFLVRNSGGGSLEGVASTSLPFSIQGTASFALSTNETTSITVRFAPTEDAPANGAVTFTGGGGAVRPVSGIGVPFGLVFRENFEGGDLGGWSGVAGGGNPEIDVSPSLLDYGALEVGQTLDLSFTVQNVGQGNLSGIATTGLPYSVVSGSPYNLGAGDSTPVVIRFAPAGTGSFPGQVVFSGGTGATRGVTGTAFDPPFIDVTPMSLDFGSVSVGASSDLTFDVSNTGGGTLTGAASTAAPYSVVGGSPYTIASGSSAPVTIRFAPDSEGPHIETVSFTGGGGASRGVTGNGGAGPFCPPGGEDEGSSLYLVGGTLNGQPITPASRTIVVASGQSITGSIDYEVNSAFASSAVMASGITPSWGNHATSFASLGGFSTPVTGLQRTAPVDLVAPTTPGTHYILIAFQGEFTADQVMSATNWAASAPVWDNGDDIASWTPATIDEANTTGRVCAQYLPSARFVPATAVEVVVAVTGGTYHFDENTGTLATDSLGDNDGTVSGASWTPGHSGSALAFGSPDTSNVRLPRSVFDGFGNSAYFEAWVYPTAYPPAGRVGTIFRKRGAFNDWELDLRADGTLYSAIAGEGGINAQAAWAVTTATVPLNQWTMVASHYDGNQLTIYINGVPTSGDPMPLTLDWDAPNCPSDGYFDNGCIYGIWIGATSEYSISTPHPNYRFFGKIDEVLVHSGPSAGPVVLAEDTFDDGIISGWTTYGSCWSESSGLFHCSTTPPNSAIAAIWSGGSAWVDYSVEADVKPLSTYEPSSTGIVFRFQSEYPSGQFCECDLYRYGGTFLSLYCPGGPTYSTPFAFNTSSFYRLRATVTGNQATCEVVGAPGSSVSGSFSGMPSLGSVGLRSTHIASDFDNFIVTE